MTETITAPTIGKLAEEAVNLCSDRTAMNLVLSVRFDLPVSTDPFIASNLSAARDWQSPTRPTTHHLNHGEYMHRFGDPIEYLASELSRKPSSNRACVSLVSSEAIFTSGDGSLPSFLLLQAGFDDSDPGCLYLTAYYRALEVSEFLPINLAEMAIVAEALSTRLPSIGSVELTIVAFRAHLQPSYRVHLRSAIDIASDVEVQAAVAAKDSKLIGAWLTEKARPESLIELQGLVALQSAAESNGWDGQFIAELKEAIVDLATLRESRTRGTHGPVITKLHQSFQAHLITARRLLPQR